MNNFRHTRNDFLLSFNQNVFVTMADGENYYEVESAEIFLNGTSFENAVVCIDLEVSFGQNLYKGKQFDIWFE